MDIFGGALFCLPQAVTKIFLFLILNGFDIIIIILHYSYYDPANCKSAAHLCKLDKQNHDNDGSEWGHIPSYVHWGIWCMHIVICDGSGINSVLTTEYLYS